MAHEIEFDNKRGINPIAFVGNTPWHGLGQQLPPDSSLDIWAKQAGMDWEINSAPVSYRAQDPNSKRVLQYFPGKKALFRSDTAAPLSIVSKGYKIVHPAEILEFFRDLTESGGFKLNTAGVLFGGKKFWALAETGHQARIMGQDQLNSFLLLATSCDGSLATTAMFTSVRVVCNNTLSFAVQDGESGKARQYLKIPHSQKFNPEAVKAELGLAEKSFDTFIDSANRLARRKVSDKEALEWLVRVFASLEDDEKIDLENLKGSQSKNVKECFELFQGAGVGSSLKSSEGTAWGLVNAVTEFADHRRNTRTVDSRLDNAWFGSMGNVKTKAWEKITKLAA